MRVAYSLLLVDEVEKIVWHYYGIKNAKCHLIRSHRNDIYEASSSGRKYIFKIYSISRSEEDVVSEVNFLTFLQGKDILVNTPTITTNNEKYIPLDLPEGIRFAILFSYENGTELDYRNPENAFLYGENVAKLHLVSREYRSNVYNEINIGHMLFDAINVIEFFSTNYKDREWDRFQNFIEKIITIFSAMNTSKMSMGYIHGDLHGGNVVLNGNDLIFYDFEHSGFGFICYELSVFRWITLIRNREDQWDKYLNGYRSLISISDHELQFSLVLVCIRDILIMANTVNLAYKFGKASVHDYYIQKRFEFIDKMSLMMNI